MGFWTGFLVGLVIGQVALVGLLALFHMNKDHCRSCNRDWEYDHDYDVEDGKWKDYRRCPSCDRVEVITQGA